MNIYNGQYIARSPLGDMVRFHTYQGAASFIESQNDQDGPLLAWHAFETVCFLAGRTILPVSTLGYIARRWTMIHENDLDGGAA